MGGRKRWGERENETGREAGATLGLLGTAKVYEETQLKAS